MIQLCIIAYTLFELYHFLCIHLIYIFTLLCGLHNSAYIVCQGLVDSDTANSDLYDDNFVSSN